MNNLNLNFAIILVLLGVILAGLTLVVADVASWVLTAAVLLIGVGVLAGGARRG